ncbi:hypothetical protein M430DRAFT_179742 [Amorphotheca resinae ATCC 22711]|uniref:Uncharacterized protein n=1 Tax=Amorphotheca resinae ATCC 22711 TaxID=857342 RepID=A0A2T3ATM5_AMORE|nr:hypothetical protein M430DRAFT_179742 [Amorphotheca resinae ATCC 22711]PSS10839.1 hypothetical protein M430DRAFT_179742 [Amorphotheca resinae ATCC 22711]
MQRAQGGLSKSDAAITGRRAGSLTGRKEWDIDADSCSRPAGDPVPLHWDRRGLADDWEKKESTNQDEPSDSTASAALGNQRMGLSSTDRGRVPGVRVVRGGAAVRAESEDGVPIPVPSTHHVRSPALFSQAAREYSCVVVAVSRSVV